MDIHIFFLIFGIFPKKYEKYEKFEFFHKHNFLGTTQDLAGFQTLHANGMCWEVDAHLFFLNFWYFFKKYTKFNFFINMISQDL